MKCKVFCFVFLQVFVTINALSQPADSLYLEDLEQAVVSSVRAQKNAPFAVANVESSELESFSKSGRELPFLFMKTPGVQAWSDNGTGIGTSYLRIRGAGDSRINVTIDGLPLNSPEDECVFWANMNGYSSMLESVQIQRGVGSSTGGDGAFGGTISLKTKSVSYNPEILFNASYGSFNTMNVGTSFSTGLLWNHLIIEAGYSGTGTDGYMHGSSGRSGSYHASASWLGSNFLIRFRNIGNYEHTGQAWNGATAGNDDLSLMDGTYGISTGIKTYADMYAAGLGRYNSLYESLLTDAEGNFIKNAKGQYQSLRYSMSDGTLWPQTTDNFNQNHSILSASWTISERLRTSLALRYTYGYGYYEEFRPNNKLSKFGLSFVNPQSGEKLKRTDFVRRKGLGQNTLGAVYNLSYRSKDLDIIGGLTFQHFNANHFGYLNYIADASLSRALLTGGDYSYYDSDAVKNDLSGFIKVAWHLNNHLDAFGDLQYRKLNYRTDGVNDKFVDNPDGTYSNQALDIDKKYNFFNPKAGVNYSAGAHRAYASAAISHREPERNNFTDNGSYPAPNPERLLDYELGYQYSSDRLSAAVNLYYMAYRDQFVQTGQLSDIGEALTTNINKSYRAGVELSAAIEICPWLRVEGNAALSKNKILDFDEYVEDWDNGYSIIHYDNSTLAFSPEAILNGFIETHFDALDLVWHTSYVSSQYLDNTCNDSRSLPAYSVSSINAQYTIYGKKLFKELSLGLRLDNVFNAHYAANAWVYSAIYASGGHPDSNRYYQIGFYPMAGISALGSITLKF